MLHFAQLGRAFTRVLKTTIGDLNWRTIDSVV